jgi:hypothetical protein
MKDSSQVNYMGDSSQVNCMRNSSQVKEMRDLSRIICMKDSSQVNYMGDSSQVKEMRDSSQVKEMWSLSQVNKFYSNNIINCYGYNYIFVPNNIKNISNIKLNETSQIIRFDTFETKPTVDFYLKNYKILKKDENTLLLYKAVHKNNGEYYSNYDIKFNYFLNKTIIDECSKDIRKSCNAGLHVSDLHFAVNFGKNWEDLAILLVEVNINDIVISIDCDGKIRTNKLKVIRELNISEYQHFL